MGFDPAAIRRQCPLLNGQKSLVYLDSAATTQKPRAVLDAMDRFYRESNANIHRGMYPLAVRATDAYEEARSAVQRFINARHPSEIIFTRGCTEAINLVAQSFGASLSACDAVVLSVLEHHSNIVPWLMLKERLGVDVLWVDIDDSGHLRMNELDEHLHKRNVKLVSVTGLSNVLGMRPQLEEIIERSHGAGARVMIDAAQMAAHEMIDVQKLDCDFLAFSGHKVYGPTGISVLYGKRDLLEKMPPFLGGGMMIHEVHRDRFTCADPPLKFEAGTPPIAEAIGLGAALEWLQQFPMDERLAHEKELIRHALEALKSIQGLEILGPAKADMIAGCISFFIENIHPHDLTELLGKKNICLRAGHHCTQPLHRRLGITASTRLSVGIYSSKNDIDRCIQGIADVHGTFIQ